MGSFHHGCIRPADWGQRGSGCGGRRLQIREAMPARMDYCDSVPGVWRAGVRSNLANDIGCQTSS